MLTLVTRFCARVHAFVDGTLDAATLVQESRTAFATFRANVRATAPVLLPYADADAAAGATDVRAYLQLDEDEDGDVPLSVAPQGPRCMYLNEVRTRIAQCVVFSCP